MQKPMRSEGICRRVCIRRPVYRLDIRKPKHFVSGYTAYQVEYIPA